VPTLICRVVVVTSILTDIMCSGSMCIVDQRAFLRSLFVRFFDLEEVITRRKRRRISRLM